MSEVESTIHSSLHSTYQDVTGPSLWMFTVSCFFSPFRIVPAAHSRSQSARVPNGHRSPHRRFFFSLRFTCRPNRLPGAQDSSFLLSRVGAAYQLSDLHSVPLCVLSEPHAHRSHRFGIQPASSPALKGVVHASDGTRPPSAPGAG